MNTSTNKIPPGWGPDNHLRYSFKKYKRDLKLWIQNTELDQHKIGPAIALRLEGVARKIADHLSNEDSDVSPGNEFHTLISHGRFKVPAAYLPGGARVVEPGYVILITALNDQFGQLGQERQIQYLMDFFMFQPKRGERTPIQSSRASSSSGSRASLRPAWFSPG